MSPVKPVPDGYQTLTPALNLKGADQAIEFYKKAFGAEERFRMPGPGGVVMHAELQIGSSVVMLSEAMQDPPTVGSIFMYVPDADAAFDRAVKAGAKVKMPMQDMFWGDRFGKVTDPNGIGWGIATHKEDLSPAEMDQRMKAAMAAMAAQGGPK
ncbi:MAG: VOC family protein [Deltaproteobacteria bacterium]|nr:VOC family protein [Deltaproteobacteria bacterium]